MQYGLCLVAADTKLQNFVAVGSRKCRGDPTLILTPDNIKDSANICLFIAFLHVPPSDVIHCETVKNAFYCD